MTFQKIHNTGVQIAEETFNSFKQKELLEAVGKKELVIQLLLLGFTKGAIWTLQDLQKTYEQIRNNSTETGQFVQKSNNPSNICG